MFPVFDGVVRVVEDAVESLVQVRNVIAAIEVVVNVDFPIAIEGVTPSRVEMEPGQPERRNKGSEVSQEPMKRHRVSCEIYKYEVFPGLDRNRNQPIG